MDVQPYVLSYCFFELSFYHILVYYKCVAYLMQATQIQQNRSPYFTQYRFQSSGCAYKYENKYINILQGGLTKYFLLKKSNKMEALAYKYTFERGHNSVKTLRITNNNITGLPP